MSNSSTIATLAEKITAIGSDRIGDKARNAAKLAVLDVIGCAVSGGTEPTPVAHSRWALSTFGEGPCTVWFSGRSSSFLGAVTANAAAGSAMDGDDTHWPSWMHSGSSIVPAAIGAAECFGKSGKEMLEAIVIGYEVTTRIAQSVDWPTMHQIATGHWCCFGAAAAVARLRGASAAELARAFSVVAAHRPYVYARGDGLNLNGIKEGIPWGTFVGLSSLDLAVCGLEGPLHALDNSLFDSSIIVKDSFESWNIERVSIKPFATCAWPHAPSEALNRIMVQRNLKARDIQEVTVTTFPQALTYINNEADPQTLEAAQYNIPFNVAVMAFDGPAGLLPLRSSTLRRPELVDLAKRVHLVGSPEYGADLPAKHRVNVAVKTSQGVFEQHLDTETNPKDFPTLLPKFNALTADGWTEDQRRRVIGFVEELAGPIDELTKELKAPLKQAGVR